MSTGKDAQEHLTLEEEEESAVDATEEHDDDAQPELETPINIVGYIYHDCVSYYVFRQIYLDISNCCVCLLASG